MKFIIKPFAEIMVKSKPVRKRFINILQTNITNSLKRTSLKYKVSSFWDFLEVNIFSQDFNIDEIKKVLSRIPGIDSFLEVEKIEAIYKIENEEKIFDLDYLGEKVFEIYENKIKEGTFAVRIKRTGKHNFTSSEAERYIGGYLLKALEKNGYKGKVKLKEPDTKVEIEINSDKILIVKDNIACMGGYPVGTQEKVISLISGGFDSGVSTYSMMKRGCRVDFLFFNLGGSAHELGVKQVAYYLNQTFSAGYDANIIIIPFEDIIKELLTKVDHRFRGILLKRFMLKIADMISQEYGYLAVVKGDSLGQVSSQTLKNMFVIDKACETLVLRPLITFNKQEIVNIAMKIGTYNFAINMPEYCGIISDKPSTGAKLDDIINEEKKIEEEVLLEAYNNKKVEKVGNLVNDLDLGEIELAFLPGENEIIIDIREKDIINKNPLVYENIEIIKIPFFDINNRFSDLDQSKIYLFYCDKGVLSNLHGLYLKEKGFNNIKVFRPLIENNSCKI